LSDAKQLGSTGAYNIIKKIPINAPFGSVIYDNEIISVDYINVSNREAKQPFSILQRSLNVLMPCSFGNATPANQKG
jgi:hypothetical protein